MDEIRTRSLVPGQRHRIRPVTVGLLFRLVPLQVVLAVDSAQTGNHTRLRSLRPVSVTVMYRPSADSWSPHLGRHGLSDGNSGVGHQIALIIAVGVEK